MKKIRNNPDFFKKIKTIISVALIVLMVTGTLIIERQTIAAVDRPIEKSYSNIGYVALELKIYDQNGNKKTINPGDISIYKQSDLYFNNKENEYYVKNKMKEEQYSLYGDKIDFDIKIYTNKEKNINEIDQYTYKVNINDIDSKKISLTDKYNLISFNDYNSLITIEKNKVINAGPYSGFTDYINQNISTQLNDENQNVINTILDKYVIVINNDEILNSILEIKFGRKIVAGEALLNRNIIVPVSYELESEKNKDLVINVNNIEEDTGIDYLEKFKDSERKEKRTLADYGDSSEFVRPVSKYSEMDINLNENIISYTINNGTAIQSIGNNGIVEKTKYDNIIKVKYTDKYSVYYKNIIPSVQDKETVNAGEILGIIEPNKKLEILNLYDNETELCEWMFDRFEDAAIGKNMPRMYQSDDEWGSESYGSNTIASSGCGPSAFSMVLSYYKGRAYTPSEVVKHMYEMGGGSHSWCYLNNEGSYYSMFGRICEEYGLNCDEISISEQLFKEELESGKCIIICVKNGPVYKGGGHFIVIRDVTEDGKFLINDSANFFDLNTGYTYSDLGPITMARAIYN